MKECFKNWVLTHEKLYKLIVFVLALVAFLAVTVHGCKTMRADAATATNGVYYPDLWTEVDWGEYAHLKDTLKNENDNFIISKYVHNAQYRINLSSGVRTAYRWNDYEQYEHYAIDDADIVIVENNKVTLVIENSVAPIAILGGEYQHTPIASTYDYGTVLENYPRNNASYTVVNPPRYLVNAPYFSHVSTEMQNPILLKNAALDRMYTEVQFKLMGQPMTPAGGYEAEFFVDVYLPSMDFLHDMVYLYVYEENTSSSLYGSTYSEFQYKLNESYQKWWLNVSRGKESYKKFTLRFTQTYEHPIDGNVLLNLPHDYLLDCIETGYGSVEEMYLGGITSDKHIYEFCYPTLLKFLTVGQVGNIVHTYNYPDVYYGRYTTITYKANLSEPVITEYNDDYFATGGSDSVDKVVQEEINNAYNDEADKLQSDNEALQDMLDAYYRGENAFSDYNSSDVWSFLSDTTKGLVSVLPSLSGLAAVVGVVFGFLPIQISGMIMTLFVICIFTAIIRFIRG